MEYIFETERLNARKFETADAESLFRIHRDAEVQRWIPGESYADLEEARAQSRPAETPPGNPEKGRIES